VTGQPPFVVFALPRSRTRWLAAFLNYGDWSCGHDEIRHVRSLDDVKSWLAQPCTGTVETAGASFWRLLMLYRPDARVVTIRRPVEEVLCSFAKTGMDALSPGTLRGLMYRLDHKLDQIEHRVPGTRSFAYEDLKNENICADIFTHCLPYTFDQAWWDEYDHRNIQINLTHLLRYFEAHRPQLEKVQKQAKHRMLSALPHRVPDIEGVTFQQEPVDIVYNEGVPLFKEHLIQTDQAPDAYLHKNVPVLRKLEELGALQVMAARSNGRLFGYLVSVIGPSLDDVHKTMAWHTIFFASPLIKNLGMQLQRHAVQALRARGISEVQMRTGVRGLGPRLGTFYRRLGAEELGQLYRLSLEN
jgi:hypothetical protein